MKLNTVANEQSLHRDSLNPDRLFYVVAASIMFVFTTIGFRSFYLHGKGAGGSDMTSQIAPLIVVHGLAIFGWVILFYLQSIHTATIPVKPSANHRFMTLVIPH
jgi:hypothetical protein